MQTSIINEIRGTWILESIRYYEGNNPGTDLYGENPIGILTYTVEGYMNAQLGSNDRIRFKTEGLKTGTPEEIIQAYKNYMAYYGTYYEREPGVIIHEVIGCLYPNWEGREEIRYAGFENGKLIISTPPSKVGEEEAVVRVVWNRQ